MTGFVLCIGSAAMDLVVRTDRFARPGETLVGEFATYPGGKGANQAAAIGKLGGHVSFVGCVGQDAYGQRIRCSLESAGVDVSHLFMDSDHPTGIASIVVDSEGRNQIIVAPGANSKVSAEQVRRALEEAPEALVLAQLEIPEEAVLAASAAKRFMLNPAPARDLPNVVLERCFAVTPNETEAETLTGVMPKDRRSYRESARKLLNRGVQNVVITLGERGCYWMSARGEELVPAPRVKASDTVAAGDAFSGALALAISRGSDWHAALSFANGAAALSTTRLGAQTSMPTSEEVRAFLAGL